MAGVQGSPLFVGSKARLLALGDVLDAQSEMVAELLALEASGAGSARFGASDRLGVGVVGAVALLFAFEGLGLVAFGFLGAFGSAAVHVTAAGNRLAVPAAQSALVALFAGFDVAHAFALAFGLVRGHVGSRVFESAVRLARFVVNKAAVAFGLASLVLGADFGSAPVAGDLGQNVFAGRVASLDLGSGGLVGGAGLLALDAAFKAHLFAAAIVACGANRANGSVAAALVHALL